MINSMTGFGSSEVDIPGFGRMRVELRSTNHKFLEIVTHLPEGFLSLEDTITKEIESKIKRGRVVLALHIVGGCSHNVFINKRLLQKYVSAIQDIKGQLYVKDEVSADTLIRLPGVLSLTQSTLSKGRIWPRLKTSVNQALENLVKTRRKEGAALNVHLKKRGEILKTYLAAIEKKFKAAIKERSAKLPTDEERSSFLKSSDITEEIDRLGFHIKSFSHKLSKGGPIGKELDFIAQEMQREANTTGAKSCDKRISSQVIHIKSQIEKIREQLQNIE